MVVNPLFAACPAWRWTTLGDVCSGARGCIQTGPFGSQLHASDYVPSGIPVIMPQNIGDNEIVQEGIACVREADAERLSRHRVRVGDIVYSRRGDVERRALVREGQEGWLCGTGCLLVRVDAGVTDPAYASYYLGHPAVREWIVRHAIGATMPNLNTSIMASVPFLLPPLPEQRAIAHVLGTLDDKIALNRRMNETLEAMARALFKSWFVDFDPVRAKAEGRDPGLPPDLAALFPDGFEDSELGEIPRGWRVGALGDVVSPVRRSLLPLDCPDQTFAHYSIPAFDAGRIPMLEKGRDIKSSKWLVPEGSVLLSRLNPRFPRVWQPEVDDRHRAICSSEFLVLVPGQHYSTQYVSVLLSSSSFQRVYGTLVTGTSSSHQRVPVDAALRMRTLLPSPDVTSAYTEAVRPLLARLSGNRKQVGALIGIRDALLPHLMSSS